MIKLSSTTKTLATGLGAVALSLGGLALSGNSAQAATLTSSQTLSISNTPTDWTQALSFNRFNTALGTLNSVTINMEASSTGSGSVTNNGSSLAGGTVTLSAYIGLNDSFGNELGSLNPIFQETLTGANRINPGATRNYDPVTRTDSGSLYFVVGDPSFNNFIGTGQGTLTAEAYGISGWSGAGNVTANFSVSAAASYTIIYDYTPAAVPEPLTMLGAATAVGFGAAFKRGALKKSKKD